MSTKKLLVLIATLIAFTVLFTACAGPQGEPGPAGPAGPAGPQGEPGPAAATDDLTCKECHNDTAIITGKKADWTTSVHGTGPGLAYAGERKDCAGCHDGSAFSAMISEGKNFTQVEATNASPTHQDCRTCHQIHTTYTGADWVLETDAPVAYVVSGLTFDGGNGNLCANCHQARRYMASFVDKADATKYTSTSPRFNPHLSVQGDVLMGSGGFGVEGKPGAHYSMVENTCVGCHMGEGQDHTFKPQVSACVACHADAKNFDINGARTKFEERVAELKAALTAKGLLDAEGAVVPGTWDEATATAIWNYEVIEEDSSSGAHNPVYLNALLDAAFAALGE
jgi:hypothetical protein